MSLLIDLWSAAFFQTSGLGRGFVFFKAEHPTEVQSRSSAPASPYEFIEISQTPKLHCMIHFSSLQLYLARFWSEYLTH